MKVSIHRTGIKFGGQKCVQPSKHLRRWPKGVQPRALMRTPLGSKALFGTPLEAPPLLRVETRPIAHGAPADTIVVTVQTVPACSAVRAFSVERLLPILRRIRNTKALVQRIHLSEVLFS
jgi:hypothetical protein